MRCARNDSNLIWFMVMNAGCLCCKTEGGVIRRRGTQRGKTPYRYDATPYPEMQKTRIAAGLL